MIERIFEKTSMGDVLVIIISSLAIVSFWRGLWGLMDLYLFPEDKTLSLTVSTVMGLLMLFAIAFYKRGTLRKLRKLDIT